MKKYIPFLKREPFVAVIRLQGQISNGGRGLDNPGLAPIIEKAFSKGKPAAVALEINCPGGSPVQSSLIASRIRRLADEKKIPVFAFVEDVAASGGYWLACAADEIFVDDCSIDRWNTLDNDAGQHLFESLHDKVHLVTAGVIWIDVQF